MPPSPKRVVFITGASGGLGKALCQTFSAKGDIVGAHVHLNRSAGQALIEAIERTGGKTALFSADIQNSRSVREMVQEALAKWGRLDVFIHTAAIRRDHLFAKIGEFDWDQVIDVNLSGSFFCMREAGQAMSKQGGGQIINISSGAAYTGRPGQAAYAASKRGLIALTQSAAKEWSGTGVQVNVVLPGLLPTGMADSLPPSDRMNIISENILRRLANLEEVSEFIYHLSRMKDVSGQVFNLDSRIY